MVEFKIFIELELLVFSENVFIGGVLFETTHSI